MIIYDKQKKPTTRQKQNRKRIQADSNNIIIIIIICAVLAIIGIIYFYQHQQSRDSYSYLKMYKDQPLIFTRHDNENEQYPIVVPFINIDSNEILGTNDEILSYAQSFANKNNNAITYEYEINGSILSLVLKAVNNNTGGDPIVDFKTYNINLEEIKLLNADEVLEMFGINYNQVEAILKNKFKDYYKQEVKEGYIDKSICDYECFLSWRGVDVDNYLDKISFYIKSGQLIVYKPFVTKTLLKEEKFYEDETYEFQITS